MLFCWQYKLTKLCQWQNFKPSLNKSIADMQSLLLLRFCEIKCQRNCIWLKTKKLYPNKNLCFFIMDFSICLIVTTKINTCLPSVHSKPWNPLSHPFMHVPLMWWHCSVSKQCPHCLLQFSPYVPTSQAANKTFYSMFYLPQLFPMHFMTSMIWYSLSSKEYNFTKPF